MNAVTKGNVDTVVIGIHVRRTDFNWAMKNHNRTFLEAEFFQRAVDMLTGILDKEYGRAVEVNCELI